MLLPTATLLCKPKKKEQSEKEETEDDTEPMNNDQASQSMEVDGTDQKDKVENEVDPKNGSGECSNGAKDPETMPETSTAEEVFKVKKDDIIAQVHCTK